VKQRKYLNKITNVVNSVDYAIRPDDDFTANIKRLDGPVEVNILWHLPHQFDHVCFLHIRLQSLLRASMD